MFNLINFLLLLKNFSNFMCYIPSLSVYLQRLIRTKLMDKYIHQFLIYPKMEEYLLDRHLYNPKVNQIKEIIKISNSRYRIYKLYKLLANNNYDPILKSIRNKSTIRHLNKNSIW